MTYYDPIISAIIINCMFGFFGSVVWVLTSTEWDYKIDYLINAIKFFTFTIIGIYGFILIGIIILFSSTILEFLKKPSFPPKND